MDGRIASVILIILLVVGVVAIGRRILAVLLTVTYHYGGDFINRHLLFKNLRPEYKKELARRSSFYQKLSDKDKLHFERRVQKFIDLKEFVPRGGLLEVTPAMKAMVAATAVQITFGFPRVYFQHFRRILLYPQNYYSRINQRYHQGEVQPRGLIVLSWRSFVEGIRDPADGVHLGLHEMAHALKLENRIINDEYMYLDSTLLDQIQIEAAGHINRIRNGQETFFRQGAGANFHEFFAVAVENFFERPALFREQHPRLFSLMSQLLRQTPPGL
jgi:MtfA peptidase